MKELINLYVDIFNSMETFEKVLVIFWSLCVVMFYVSFLMIIKNVIHDTIKSFFVKKPQPQRI